MTLSEAKRIARDPGSHTTDQLAEAMDAILQDDRLSEQQVTNLQAKIEPTLMQRLRITPTT